MSANAATEKFSIDEIDVPIHFALGDMAIPLRELRSIEPGFVFELGAKPVNPVTITVNGVRLGRGELVLVDGRLAVYYTEAADHGS